MEDMSRLHEMVRIVYHPRYLTNYATASCEIPSRVQSIMSFLGERFTIIEPEPCREEDILLCHSEGLIAMEKTDGVRFETARISAGGAIRAAELALEGRVPFAVIRPPGHHASPDHNWGFCFFNNMGIAVKKLIKEGKIRTAVILDIDLHFGDGTDNIFKGYRNVRVLNIQSSNPDDFINETKSSLAVIENADIIAISAGFDQYEKDWGANLSTEDYRVIGEIAGNFAIEKAGGRIFSILEGGYFVPDLGKNVLALLEGICRNRQAASIP